MAGAASAICPLTTCKETECQHLFVRWLHTQVPVIAKADSMTIDELRQFRKYIRSELEQV